MKKLILVVILLLGMVSLAYAEISGSAYSSYPRYYDEQVFAYFQNASGTDISSNTAVILDTTAATMANNIATGSAITTTTTHSNPLFVGVTDEVITDGRSGRVCIRGPHRVLANSGTGTFAAGATMATMTTAGYMGMGSSVMQATLLSTLSAEKRENNIPIENPNLYWVYIQRQ